VTIVTRGRECLFGEIADETMRLNEYGRVVQKWWDDIPMHFRGVETGVFVIMPNHVHGIIVVVDNGRGAVPAPDNRPLTPDGETQGGETQGGETPPYGNRHWDRWWHISNINQRKK